MGPDNYRKCAKAARRQEKAELVLKNGNVVNVFTEEILKADIAIVDDIIVGVGCYEGDTEIDLKGQYVCPGFIDSHLHLESTLVTPAELIMQAVIFGTTTFIVDPHESANVSGLAGIDYILEQTREVPANVYVMMPSCVPATDIDDNGGRLTAEMMEPYLKNKRILGLGEVMDYVSVIEGEERMHRKLALFEGRVRDGHAPSLSDADLQAYAMAGIDTDHECTEFSYAMKERRSGITVLIREGSAAKNLEAIVKGIVENQVNEDGFCFCTDDKHIEDIRKEGHINYNIKKSIALGLNPVKAVKMATIQPAQCYGLHHIGAVAPGYQADLVILDSLQDMCVRKVLCKGRFISENAPAVIRKCSRELRNTIHIGALKKEAFVLKSSAAMRVIQIEPGQIVTKELICDFSGTDVFQANEEYQKIAAIERHKATGKVGVGIVKGFYLRGGAIASSVSHDSHNVIVIGDNDMDMELAVNELERVQGGYTIICGGQVYETLALPIMGLMSDVGFEEVDRKLKRMIEKAHSMGVPASLEPFTTLSFLSLPVIPEIRITPRGVYHVRDAKFV